MGKDQKIDRTKKATGKGKGIGRETSFKEMV